MSEIAMIVDSKSEKPARGALFTAMQRQIGQDTILIVDGLNYIKGFRYQMYCAAREHKLRVCTVRSPTRQNGPDLICIFEIGIRSRYARLMQRME
jgi:tRNA uridine 5-carbamoylmethylation protein Kti12